MPIIADEACWTARDVLDLRDAEAIDAVSVYVAKAGGMERAADVARMAALAGFPPHYPRFLLEQAAIAGALSPEVLVDPAKATEAADYIARRLDQLSDETERGWHGEPTPDGGLKFWREVRGVREAVAIDGALIGSADARKLDRMAGPIRWRILAGAVHQHPAVTVVIEACRDNAGFITFGRAGWINRHHDPAARARRPGAALRSDHGSTMRPGCRLIPRPAVPAGRAGYFHIFA